MPAVDLPALARQASAVLGPRAVVSVHLTACADGTEEITYLVGFAEYPAWVVAGIGPTFEMAMEEARAWQGTRRRVRRRPIPPGGPLDIR